MTSYTTQALNSIREELIALNRCTRIYGGHLPADLPVEELALLSALAQLSSNMLDKVERTLYKRGG